MIRNKYFRSKLINKLCFGTANLTNNYGILKKKNKFSSKKIKEIFYVLGKNKIANIDTAISYKNVEKKIGQLDLKKFKIFTKLPKLPKKCTDINKWSLKNINHSLNSLNTKSLSGVLIHHSEDLIGKNKKKLYQALLFLKKKKLVNKIGVSIYNFKILDKILNEFKVDIIQVPFNILDRRLVTKNYLNKIKRKKIQIHVRSIFLQGILLSNFKKIPKKFFRWKNLFKTWNFWLKKNKISKLQACLNFILSFKQIDVIIFGAYSKKQIKQIINAVNQSTKIYPKNIFSNNLQLIDPRRW